MALSGAAPLSMLPPMRFGEQVASELALRRARNSRYSLRAFAASLRTHHSTLARLIGGRHRITPRLLKAIGARLRFSDAEIARFCVEENAAAILGLVLEPGFRADSRWIAERSGLPVDAVNVAIHHLIHHRRVQMAAPARWDAWETP